MKKTALILILAGLTLFLFAHQQGTALAQSNLLNNPSFEEPYNNGVAQGWAAWHEDSNQKKDCNTERYVVRPKWAPEFNPDLILDGARSMHVGNQFDTWRAGVFQTLNVPAGNTYRFTAWGRGRGSNDQYPNPSDRSVNMRMRVGIDPTGSGLWTSGSIVWSGTIAPHDAWQQVSVEVPVTSGKITVFLEGDFSGPNNCRAHLDMWFDKAELIAAGPPPTNTPAPVPTQPPPPPATATPIPSPTPVPTATPVPSPTPIPPTPTPAGGTICINTFNDVNANGQNDDSAGYMAGVRYTIAQGGSVVAEGVSPGTDSPVCFEGLAAGQYDVAQTLPAALDMTTAGNTTIGVEQGKTVGLEFGSRLKPPASPTVAVAANPQGEVTTGTTGGDSTVDQPAGQPGTVTPAASGSIGLWEIAALVIMGVAVLLLGIVVLLLYRRM